MSSIPNRYDSQMRDFGRRLQIVRERAGYTQQELADKVGMKRTNLSKIERGDTKNPNLATQMRLANALTTSLGDFLLLMSAVDLDPPEDEFDPDDRRRRVTVAVKNTKWTEDRERGVLALLSEWRSMDADS